MKIYSVACETTTLVHAVSPFNSSTREINFKTFRRKVIKHGWSKVFSSTPTFHMQSFEKLPCNSLVWRSTFISTSLNLFSVSHNVVEGVCPTHFLQCCLCLMKFAGQSLNNSPLEVLQQHFRSRSQPWLSHSYTLILFFFCHSKSSSFVLLNDSASHFIIVRQTGSTLVKFTTLAGNYFVEFIQRRTDGITTEMSSLVILSYP